MSVRTWKPHPLYITIVEILEKKGALTDVELFNLLKESYGDVGFRSVNKTLMEMEIGGKIYVSMLARGKRRVELMQKKAGA